MSKLSGISNGLCFQFNFFLTSFISSSPSGDPCDDALPDLFGEPKPIIVLHAIIEGTLLFLHILLLDQFLQNYDHQL